MLGVIIICTHRFAVIIVQGCGDRHLIFKGVVANKTVQYPHDPRGIACYFAQIVPDASDTDKLLNFYSIIFSCGCWLQQLRRANQMSLVCKCHSNVLECRPAIGTESIDD